MPLPNISDLMRDRSRHSPSSKAKTRHSSRSLPRPNTSNDGPKMTTAIPTKFSAASHTAIQRDFSSFIRATSTAPDTRETIYGSEAPSTFVLQTMTASTQAPTFPTSSTFGSSPSMPNWAVQFLAGTLSFLLVVAVLLYLAQFPPRFTWLKEIVRRKNEYTPLNQHNTDCKSTACSRSSAEASSQGRSDECEVESSECLMRRRPQHLSIDTSSHYRGLVIAKAGLENEEKEADTRRSYDAEALRVQPKSSVTAAWQYYTAPLPSARSFGGGHRASKSQSATTSQVLGTGPYYTPALTVSSPDLFDHRSLHHEYSTPDAGAEDEKPLGSAVFQKINDGIYKAADRLSKTFHDQVTGPEDGLLLPVYNSEREQPLSPSVFHV